MWSGWVLAPRWLLSIVSGVYFGGVMLVLFVLTEDGGWIGGLVGALVGGILFGAFMGWYLANQNRHVVELADLEDRDELLQAVRASRRGPVPTDPRVRSAASRIAVAGLRQSESQYRFAVALFAILALAGVVLAALESPWWLLATVFGVGLAAMSFYAPTKLSRRVVTLGAPEDETTPVSSVN